MTIRQQIESLRSFTETEKSVANFILERPQDISDISIRDIAKITYTSTPTVLRVCRKLGYDGFKEFKKALLLELENEKHLFTNIDASHPFNKNESPTRIIGALGSLYKQSVESTAALLRSPEVSKIADDIFHANRLFLYAIGDTRITCQLFANKLLKLNKYPVFATENYQEVEETYNLRKDDYALFVTYKGTYPGFVSCAVTLKRRNIKTGLITCNTATPLASLCTTMIQLPNTEQINNIATFHSQISIGFVLNVLYSLIYEKDYEHYAKHKELLDSTRFCPDSD